MFESAKKKYKVNQVQQEFHLSIEIKALIQASIRHHPWTHPE